eukprot:jgi/Undpi1/7309/HiC_scaffold_22.g09782.m1
MALQQEGIGEGRVDRAGEVVPTPLPPPPLRFSSYSLLEPTPALSAASTPRRGGGGAASARRVTLAMRRSSSDQAPRKTADRSQMTCKVVEYAEQDLTGVLSGMSALSLATGPHRRRDQGPTAPAHVLVVDGNMREDALADLARSVDKVLSTMEPEALVSLVVFTGVVSVYRLGRPGAAVADVLPGGEALTDKILGLLRGQREGQGQIGSGVGGSGGGGGGGGRGGRGGGGGARRRAWGGRRVPVPTHRRRRCLGAAVEVALRLARTADRPSSRLLVCLGGCPNFGPGAVAPCVPGAASAEVDPEALAAATDYFEDLGERALLQVGSGVGVGVRVGL